LTQINDVTPWGTHRKRGVGKKARVFMRTTTQTLILGIGNSLLSDDGVGVHIVRALETNIQIAHLVALRDGGTIGLELLAEVEQFNSLIAIDAMELDDAPGAMQVFQGLDMDKQLRGSKRTAHEVALSDLISAAHLAGTVPQRRALIAIQPGSTDWGLAPTKAVGAAIPKACKAVASILESWNDER
jgi:hydrogenase maturation protease